jgi:uncharacterized lipoprotein YmbA
MKKWVMILSILLAACSSAPPTKHYYQLPATVNVAETRAVRYRTLQVAPIQVADFLAADGIVYQSNDVRYVTAQNNLWASPLTEQLQLSLVQGLRDALPDWQVGSADQGTVLSVTVTGFHGRYDGKALVQGVWSINGKQTRYFHLLVPQDSSGYDALVRTLGKAWQLQVKEIAKSIMESQS